MELYAAGAALLGLGWLYTKSQEYQPPPTIINNTDSDPMSVDLMQKKKYLYGGNPTANLPLGLQQRRLPNYDGLSPGDVLRAVRSDYNAAVTDYNLIPNLVAKSVHAGQVVQPTSQNGYNMQVTMDPGNPRALILEAYSRSGLPSVPTAYTTTALGRDNIVQAM